MCFTANALRPENKMLIHRPILRQDCCVYAIPGEGHIFLSDQESFAVEGRVANSVIPLIDGRRTSGEIAQTLSSEFSEQEILEVMSYLYNVGHVLEAKPDVGESEEAFWGSLGLDASLVRQKLKLNPIEISCTGEACNSSPRIHADPDAAFVWSKFKRTGRQSK